MKTADKIYLAILVAALVVFIAAVALTLTSPAGDNGKTPVSRTVVSRKPHTPGAAADTPPAETGKTPPAATVSGKITDEQGNPQPEAFVDIAGPGGRHFQINADNEGSYILRAVPPGVYNMEARCPGFVPAGKPGLRLKPGVHRKNVDFKLSRGAGLTLIVSDGEGKPISGLRLGISAAASMPSGRGRHFSAMSDKTGTAIFPHVEVGEYRVVMRDKNYLQPRERIFVNVGPEGRTEKLTFELAGTYSGTVRDIDGKPLAGVRITMRSNLTPDGPRPHVRSAPITDAEGRFTVRGIPPGTFILTARKNGYKTVNVPDVEFAAGQRETGRDIVLDPGMSISGRVTSEEGDPLRGVKVYAYWPNNQSVGITDADGEFTVSGLDEGRLRLQAYLHGYATGLFEGVTAGTTGMEIKLKRTSRPRPPRPNPRNEKRIKIPGSRIKQRFIHPPRIPQGKK